MRIGPDESNKKVMLGAVVILSTVVVGRGIDPYHNAKKTICKKMGTVLRFWPFLPVF
jgi:hypothetical protein